MVSYFGDEKGFNGLALRASNDETRWVRRPWRIIIGNKKRWIALLITLCFLLINWSSPDLRQKTSEHLFGPTAESVKAIEVHSNCALSANIYDRFACQHETTRKNFDVWLSSHSQTLEEAKRKYREQRGRQTPQWFATWYEWSKANGVIMIDGYDQIEKDLEPLRNTKQEILRNTMAEVSKQNLAEEGKRLMAVLRVKDGKATCNLPRAEGAPKALLMLIEPIQHLLPDLEILVNFAADPILVGPSEGLSFLSSTSKVVKYKLDPHTTAEFERRSCLRENNILDTKRYPRLQYKDRHSTCVEEEFDFLRQRHGRYQHFPEQYNITFPVLSVAKMASNEDILFPMRGYQYGLIQASDKKRWDEKLDSVYWRGATSGQYNTLENWNKSHRSRFVLNAHFYNQTSRSIRQLPAKQRNSFIRTLSRSVEATKRDLTMEGIQALAQLSPNTFNITFTGRQSCDKFEEACDRIEKAAPFGARMPASAAHDHKFLFDIDGLGMSERYYHLLLSNSVVLKQTEWAEWHDEIIIPWIHFVPVSLGMQELPSLLHFLINDPRGQSIARAMSSESVSWVRSALGFQAQQAYMLRLLLEYADIMTAA